MGWSRALLASRADLPPEVVLMLRILGLAWLLTGHALLLPTRSVPFVKILDPIGTSTLVGWAQLVIGVVCAAQLVLGRAVRSSALTLGALIFASTLLSRAFFSNNRLYVACLLVLAGLESAKGPPRLLRTQIIVLYLAAGLDKLLDADWRSGAFMRSFVTGLASHGRFWSPGHDSSGSYLPARLVGSIIGGSERLAIASSWATFLLEIGIGLAFLAGLHRLAIAAGVLFHVGVLVHTGGPMGMFFYAALASYLAFVRLPDGVEVDVRAGLGRALASIACMPAFYLVATVILAGPWFSPWSVLVLVPIVATLRGPRPASAPRPEVGEVPD